MPSYLENPESVDLSRTNLLAQGFDAEIPVSEVQLTAVDYDIRAMTLHYPISRAGDWFVNQTGNLIDRFDITFSITSPFIDIVQSGGSAWEWTDTPPFQGLPNIWQEYKYIYLITTSKPGGVTQVFEIDDLVANTINGRMTRLVATLPATTSTTHATEGYLLWAGHNEDMRGHVFNSTDSNSIFPLWNPGGGFRRESLVRFDPTKWGGNKFYISDWTIYDWGTNSGLSAGSRDMATNYASSESGTPITKCNFDSAADLVTALENILERAGWNISSTVTSIPNAAALDALSHSNKDIILYYKTYATTELNSYSTTALQFAIYEPSTTEADDRYHIDLSADPVFGQINVKANMNGVFKGIWDAPISAFSASTSTNPISGEYYTKIEVPIGMYIQNGDFMTISGCDADGGIVLSENLNAKFLITDVNTGLDTSGRADFTIPLDYVGEVATETGGIDPTKRVSFNAGEGGYGALAPYESPQPYGPYSVGSASSISGTNATIPVYQETGVRVETTDTTTTIPEDSTLVNDDNDNGIYLENSTDVGDGEFEIFIKYTLYDGSDALVARKLVEMGVPVSPDNIKWYRTHLDVPDESEFEMELDEVEFEALEYEPDYELEEKGYNYDDERQGS